VNRAGLVGVMQSSVCQHLIHLFEGRPADKQQSTDKPGLPVKPLDQLRASMRPVHPGQTISNTSIRTTGEQIVNTDSSGNKTTL
jgi:hypothetical protein